jgi:uncharacterized tellurite resistance protein B-like protein
MFHRGVIAHLHVYRHIEEAINPGPAARPIRNMLDNLRQFISELTAGNRHDHRAFEDDDYRLAATALLIHVISLDGDPSDAELGKLHHLLEQRFNLDPGQANELVKAATRAEGEAVDVFHFTNQLMRALDERGRARIIEMMWELAYADGRVSEFEESMIWRAADLLGISSAERIALKHLVAGGQPPGDAAS